MNRKLTFTDIVERLAQVTNSPERVCELFLKELFATVSQSLIDGRNVNIKGIGTFKVVKAGSRRSVGVSGEDDTNIPSRGRVIFTPDKALAEAINEPFAHFKTIELSEQMTDELLAKVGNEPDELAESGDEGDAVTLNGTESSQAEASSAEPSSDPINDIESSENEDNQEALTPPPFKKFLSETVPVDNAETPIPPEPESESDARREPIEQPAEPKETEVDDAENSLSTENLGSAEEYSVEEDAENHVPESAAFFTEEEMRKEAKKSLVKGFIWGVLVASFLCAVVAYVAYPKQSLQYDANADSLPVDSAANAASIDSVMTDSAKSVVSAPTTNVTEKQAVVLDTLTAKMVLFRMARKHYGEAHFWVYIYQENRDKIRDPNNVEPGTVVVIPPKEKYGIDPNDKQSVNKAKRLSYEILSQY